MAENSARRFDGRRRPVRKFKDRFELLESFSPKARIILKSLGAGSHERDAARDAQAAKSTVTYWKDKFVKLGLLQLVNRDVFQTFRFTPFGSKVATGSEVRGEVRVFEDYPWKFGVVEWEKRRIVWEKLGQPKNWDKLGARVGGIRVVRTSGAVIIHPGRFKGFDDLDLEALSLRTVEWVRRVLEDKFGMVLEEEGTRIHDPVTRFFSKEAEEDAKYGTTIVEGVGSVDQSPPENRPHEEYVGRERARARLLLPDTVRRLELKVDELAKQVQSEAASVSKLVDMFSKIMGPAEETRAAGRELPKEDYSS